MKREETFGRSFVRGRETARTTQTLVELDRTASNCVELGQTRTNSNTLKIGGRIRQKPMNYEGWSKSNELEQTLTPNFVLRDDGKTEEKIFEQKETKVTK